MKKLVAFVFDSRMARGFVYWKVIADWFSRKAFAHRVAISMEAGFCVEEASAR
jgi:hypothetical protein